MLETETEEKNQIESVAKPEVADIVINEDAPIKKDTIEANEMSIKELIIKMTQFSEYDNILSVSKKAEEVRSIFYQKLKELEKEDVRERANQEENPKKSSLHPAEIEFKKVYNKFKREKSQARKKKDEEERNLGNMNVLLTSRAMQQM